MPIISISRFNREVNPMSLWEGIRHPPGWLCKKYTDVARFKMLRSFCSPNQSVLWGGARYRLCSFAERHKTKEAPKARVRWSLRPRILKIFALNGVCAPCGGNPLIRFPFFLSFLKKWQLSQYILPSFIVKFFNFFQKSRIINKKDWKCAYDKDNLQILIWWGVTLLWIGRFLKKAWQKLLSIGIVRILRKFSIKCSHFIGFEASILPLCASTTVSIVSSKLRKPITSDCLSKIYYCGKKAFCLTFGYVQ